MGTTDSGKLCSNCFWTLIKYIHSSIHTLPKFKLLRVLIRAGFRLSAVLAVLEFKRGQPIGKHESRLFCLCFRFPHKCHLGSISTVARYSHLLFAVLQNLLTLHQESNVLSTGSELTWVFTRHPPSQTNPTLSPYKDYTRPVMAPSIYWSGGRPVHSFSPDNRVSLSLAFAPPP